MAILEEISELLQKGKRKDVARLCQQAIEEGIPAKDILDKGLLAGMNVMGFVFYGENIYENRYYGRKYYKKYGYSYDHRRENAVKAASTDRSQKHD